MRFLRKIIPFFFITFTTFAHADVINTIAAVVNDQVITEVQLINAVADLRQQLGETQPTLDTKDLRKKALDQLIDQDLLWQFAKLANINISDQAISDAMAQLAQEHQISLAQLPDALAKQGIAMNTFKEQIKNQLLLQTIQQQQLAQTINLNPKEIDTLAKKLAAEKQAPQTLYHFQGLLIPVSAKPTETELTQAKQLFDTIAKAINENKSFEDISQNVLHTPPKDMGWRSSDQLPPAFAALVSKMKIGQVAPPARTPEGILILKLLEVKTLKPANDLSATVTETHARHILLKKDPMTPASALKRRIVDLRDQLAHGADFAKLAEENSQDPGSAAKGGDLGWVPPGTFDPTFEAAMNKLAMNEISQPVETRFGWHIIQVLGRRQIQDKQAAFKLKAQELLFQQKIQAATQQFISQLRAQAYVKIFDTMVTK